ncbi:hypothetical protein [[Clostridium] fimetarium]|uniref:Uncharacterized protein n=1 Tax=[Clostridium] fimetarium TaxID=99656 RepID=A0A1I0NCY0_9FIRM|nr:hypothetical protein [[Clostridium] fimetarium]SEV99120.1 hypothetical protein SAMN05421659_1039 [[Clostridium] fimetarium]
MKRLKTIKPEARNSSERINFMLEALKKAVYEANIKLIKRGPIT